MIFFMLTETWLRNHKDAELYIQNYKIFRSDRVRPKKRRGRNSGGTAIYIRDDLAASTDILLEHSNGVVETLCVYIKSINLIICLTYRQPNDPKGGNYSTAKEFNESLQKLTAVIEKLPSPTPNIILAGDFNLPKTNWPQGTAKSGATPDERDMIELLSKFTTQHFLSQHILEQTHEAGNTLDLIFTNNTDIIHSYTVTPTQPVSPHYLVSCKSPLLSSIPTAPCIKKDNDSIFDTLNLFSEETNWINIENSLVQVDWAAALHGLEPVEMTEKLINECAHLAKDNAPLKPKQNDGKTTHIPRHRKILMRKRTKIENKYSREQNATRRKKHNLELIAIEKALQKSYRSQNAYDENKAVDAISNNSKYFFAYAKKHNKLRSTIGPLVDLDGDYITNPRKLANMFSEQYKSAFSKPCQFPLNYGKVTAYKLYDMIFNESDIIHAIDELSPNAAPGPDRFPAIMLKKCKRALAVPLYIIWRYSLDTGQIPPLLKWSIITPIHKGGKKDIAKNYRPVALTSHLIKVFEKVLRNCLVSYIEEHKLFNPNQHGFRAGHSCLSQLLSHYDQITKSLEEGYNVDVIYLDFSKAFDKLDFNITLQKLYDIGLDGKILSWITSFLTNRKQSVIVNGTKSSPEDVISGVPQGSVIGPLLFLLMLGDIDIDTKSAFVSSFADDTRVMGRISSMDDVVSLQSDLESIYQWSEWNNALFNADKFECLRYGSNCEIKESTHYLSNSGTVIECKDTVKDLGVKMSDNANFTEHILSTVESAQQQCAWILRTFATRDRRPMTILWKSLVQHPLEYCSQLWSPTAVGLIQKLEMVQRSYFNKIKGLRQYDYWQQLSLLKMYSLQRRRERYMIIYLWKVLEKLSPNFGITENQRRNGRFCKVPHIKSNAPMRIKNLRHASLAVKGPLLFNLMPANIRNMKSCSVEKFKAALDKYLQTIPDQPRIPGLIRYCRNASNSLMDMLETCEEGLTLA